MIHISSTTSNLPRLDLSPTASPNNESRSPIKQHNPFSFEFQGNADDNCSRSKKVKEFLKELKGKLQIIFRDQNGPIALKDKMKKNSESLYAILDSIFSLYNINIQIITQDQADSAFKIDPVPHVVNAVHCLTCIAIMVNKFPYSFFKTIDLNKFTICKRTTLKTDQYGTIYNNRVMMNAIFMIDFHDSFEKIEKHFLRILLSHVQKKCPSLYRDWPLEKGIFQIKNRNHRIFSFGKDLQIKTSQPCSSTNLSLMSPSPSMVKTQKDQKERGVISDEEIKKKELLDVFYRLFKFTKDALENSNENIQYKAHFMKDQIELIDSIGICKTWWDDYLSYNITVSEGLLGEFKINM